MKREQELDIIARDKCFKNSALTFMEAQKCNEWVREKDYKTNLLKKFAKDHLVHHEIAYDATCVNGPEMQALKTMADKDRYYKECHTAFVRRLKLEVS